MANVSPDLLWLLVRKQNKFLYKQGGDSTSSVTFSREPFNLLNKNSFKYSGLANKKAVDISAGADLSILLSTKKTKKSSTPANLVHQSLLKKDVRKMAKTVVNQLVTSRYRPDLKDAALARLTAIHKSLRVAKAGTGKKGKGAKKGLTTTAK
eukprot:TRINITY_DN586_c6_g1_i1.p2 TRINITY_DN586_c6_g1~~TRINITY_DN586_c6_g1_i1.p2  ORF type:complete len:152 (+),score=41.55 TRINITY_DN586_c6_g1_i1:138-593(+)